MTNAVELTNVTKRFGSQAAVKNLDLAVPKGSIYGFVGPNGSGKTTTIRMILRIFQPDEGTVSVLGKTAGRAADSRLGYLPEERGLYKRMKVYDVCAYYAKLKGFYNCRPEIDSWLERLGATEWRNKRVDALSKGMAQKIQFVTSVVAKPELLILDEPFSGLDPVNLEVLRDAILQLRDAGTTVIFSTHDMDVAERLCDTVFMIFNGEKVLDGTIDSIQSQYTANKILLRLAPGEVLPDQLPGVKNISNDAREYQLEIDSENAVQPLLQSLVSKVQVERFELHRPSLHDIFVSIARPETTESTEVATV